MYQLRLVSYKFVFVSMFALALASVLSMQSVWADACLDMAISNAMNAEAGGNYAVAVRQYRSIADSFGGAGNPYRDLTPDLAVLLCRRALALLVKEARNGNNGVYGEMESLLVKLQKLEPGNSTWSFLHGEVMLKRNSNAILAGKQFRRAINSSGPESVKEKARREIARITPEMQKQWDYDQDQRKKSDEIWDANGGLEGSIQRFHRSMADSRKADEKREEEEKWRHRYDN